MTLNSAYIELFIRSKMSGGNVRGGRKCPDTTLIIFCLLSLYFMRRKYCLCWFSVSVSGQSCIVEQIDRRSLRTGRQSNGRGQRL